MAMVIPVNMMIRVITTVEIIQVMVTVMVNIDTKKIVS